MWADQRPFVLDSHAIEAVLYEDHVTTVQFTGKGQNGRPTGITATAAGLPWQNQFQDLELVTKAARTMDIVPNRPKSACIIEEIPEKHIKQIQKKAAVQATLDRINQYLAEVRKSNSLPECFDADCVWEGDEASAEEITMEDLWPQKS